MSAIVHSLAAASLADDCLEIFRGRVAEIASDGTIFVESAGRDTALACDFLRSSAAPAPKINRGDEVIYAFAREGKRGCVLGLIQKYTSQEDVPDTLTLKAGERLELRCGSSSLTMNRAGRVVVKGEDVVSRARRTSKIRGAAVKIN